MPSAQKNVTFALSEYERGFITDMVADGRFGNRSEVVRAGLRLLQDYENKEKLQRLRTAISEGDADVAAGHVTEYGNAQDLYDDIVTE